MGEIQVDYMAQRYPQGGNLLEMMAGGMMPLLIPALLAALFLRGTPARRGGDQEAVRDVRLDRERLAGFVDGEGCFYVKTSKTHSGYRVCPYFYIAQHMRDIDLLENLVIYLNCGLVETVKTRPRQSSYVVYKLYDITNKIIPFFEKYSLRGNKLLDFYYFKKVVNIVGEINKYDEHSATLKEILKIKRNMNRYR